MNEETIRRIATELDNQVTELEYLIDTFDALDALNELAGTEGEGLHPHALHVPCRELRRIYGAINKLKHQLYEAMGGTAK